MQRKLEAAMAAASPRSVEMDETFAAQTRPARWSTRRMLAVSALVSAFLWTLIALAAAALVN